MEFPPFFDGPVVSGALLVAASYYLSTFGRIGVVKIASGRPAIDRPVECFTIFDGESLPELF